MIQRVIQTLSYNLNSVFKPTTPTSTTKESSDKDKPKEKKPKLSKSAKRRKRENLLKVLNAQNYERNYNKNSFSQEFPSCSNQLSSYCKLTSLHCFRYITEKRRSMVERIFWACCCLFGICTGFYLMSKVFTKYIQNPILTSVQTTNHPVTEILHPAVTICTVNKAINEKLVIQGCRYGFTFSEMRGIIASLVDPDGRNNDIPELKHVKTDLAVKILRLVAPKCSDYLLYCRFNTKVEKCSDLFKIVISDSGICCVFNAILPKKQIREVESSVEVESQEREFEYLQEAVWKYTDKYREKNAPPATEDEKYSNTSTPIPDSEACHKRIIDDDLFPGICRYLSKCRRYPKSCRQRRYIAQVENEIANQNESDHETNSTTKMFDKPIKVIGAGRSRGLTLMLDTLRCASVPSDSFKGLRVYVHHPEEFPSISERGFIVGPGTEVGVGVYATDTIAAEVLKGFLPERRGCYFRDEFPLNYYEKYSRSSCVFECENEYIYQECQCVPYYSPANYTICPRKEIITCVNKALEAIQKRNLPKNSKAKKGKNPFQFKTVQEMVTEKTCSEFCLPACHETSYSAMISSAEFPNQPQPNATKILREAMENNIHYSFLNDIKYISASISVLRIYFRESSIMQYKRDELYTWENFISSVGGVLGLSLGFSLLSLVEAIYFFSIRLFFDKRIYNKDQQKTMEVEDTFISNPNFYYEFDYRQRQQKSNSHK